MQRQIISRLVLLLAAISQLLSAQDIVKHPDSSLVLSQRWDWAKAQANQAKFKKGYWVGYSIKRLMEENSTIGNMRIENGRTVRDGKSLAELIYGIELPLNYRTSLQEKSQRKVIKDVGLLFLFDPRDGALAEVKESTFELSVDFDDFPLLWLGRASNEQSLDLVERLYRSVASNKTKEELISAVGLHGQSPRRRIFLARIVTGNEATAVRKQAAFWLGQADDPEALKILRQAAKSDRSAEVRKQAVFALSQMDLPEAEEALFELARNQNDRQACKEALFWLAQRASKRAVDLLKETVNNDADTEIQKQAIFALTQLPDGDGVPVLIEIAQTHKNPAVRKAAIFWLGQSEDTRATDALVKLVRGK
jgi:hypothetical protein